MSNKKVLIIDDEEILRDILVDVMNINDIDSYAVSDGFQGVEFYKEHKNEIGLVLLDLLMPDESGIDTYKNLSHIDPNVEVIFMSGIGDRDTIDSLPGCGTCAFIKKPFSLDEITNKVNEHLHLQMIKPVTPLPHN